MKTLALKFTGAKFAGVKFARTTTAGDSGGRSRFVRWGGVAIVAYLLASVGTADAQETIKIGLGVPVTGLWAAYSEWPGAQCMAEMINSEGGVDGRRIEVLVQDSASDTQTAVAQAQRLLDEGAVILGTEPFDSTMIPVAQLAAPYGVSIFQPQSTQVEMHVGIVNNFFTGVSPDPFTAAAAANYALEQGVRDVVLFTSDAGGSWSAKTPVWFGDVIEAGGGRVVATLNYVGETADWSPQIAEIRALPSPPDAVYISWGVPDIGVLIRQMRSAGIDAWVIGSDGFDAPALDALGTEDPSLLDRVFFGTLAPSHDDSKVVRFIAECAALGHDIDGLFPALGADTVMAVAWAVEESGSIDPEVIADTIRNSDSIPVLSVDEISFRDTRTYAQRTIPVIGYRNGKRVLLSNEIPDNTPTDW